MKVISIWNYSILMLYLAFLVLIPNIVAKSGLRSLFWVPDTAKAVSPSSIFAQRKEIGRGGKRAAFAKS